MPRRLKARFDDHLTLDKLEAAHQRASRGKGMRGEVLQFDMNRYSNLCKILNALKNRTYLPSEYWKFEIYDPKQRLILALPYVDRILHQWYIEEFIKPYYIPRFITDSYACIPGRGSHAAVDRIQKYMRHMRTVSPNGHYYIMKMDISKFFNNIDKDILYDILERDIVDLKLLDLTYTILFDDCSGEGLPIGNYVSQYFANIYLNELDHYCKDELKIKYYVRYMDDFIALAPDKKTAKTWYELIDNFVNDTLNLRMNPKSCYFPSSHMLDFVGYKIGHDNRLVRKRSKRKICEIIEDYQNGVDDTNKFTIRANAWYGHVRHADSYRLVQQRLGQYWRELPAIFTRDKIRMVSTVLTNKSLIIPKGPFKILINRKQVAPDDIQPSLLTTRRLSFCFVLADH